MHALRPIAHLRAHRALIARGALFIVCVAACCVAGWPTRVAAAEKPNILFVFADDHAAQAISAYGSKINQTPAIDRIAKEGMLFRNCFCTNSICAPSRAVVLTGKHSHVNGHRTNGVRFNGAQQTFPKLMQKAGYQTAMVGKWHLKSNPTGFDHWEILIGQGPYYNPALKTAKGTKQHTGYTTDIITDRALAWLKTGRDPAKPFVLMYQHKAPHRNWMPGPDHLTKYDDVTIPEPSTLFDDYAGRASPAKKQEMTIARHMGMLYDLKIAVEGDKQHRGAGARLIKRLTPPQRKAWRAAYEPKNDKFRAAKPQGKELVRWKYQRYIKDYLRCIASVDDNLGRVLNYLDETGLAKNTVVIYSSDQGFYLGEHGWYDKRWMYEESLRMPLVVRWPGVVKPGSENTQLVQNLDFAETFLEMAGVDVPDDMQGQSVLPILKGESPDDWRKSIYYHYYEFPGAHAVRKHYGVRTDRHKLIHYYTEGEWELFDLKTDPHEMKSVHADPSHAKVRQELETELQRLQKLYGDEQKEKGK